MHKPFFDAINNAFGELDAISLAVFGGAIGAIGMCSLFALGFLFCVINIVKTTSLFDYIIGIYPCIFLSVVCIIIAYKSIIIAEELYEIERIKKI